MKEARGEAAELDAKSLLKQSYMEEKATAVRRARFTGKERVI